MPSGVYERTAETRRILSESRKGNTNASGKRSDSFRERMKIASIGNSSHSGHSHTEEVRNKISNSRTGLTAKEKNPNWKGGITASDRMERIRFRKQLQKEVFARDGYTCQECYQIGGLLHVDHIRRWSEYPELRFEMANCRTLCMECHYLITFHKPITEGVVWGNNLAGHRKELS